MQGTDRYLLWRAWLGIFFVRPITTLGEQSFFTFTMEMEECGATMIIGLAELMDPQLAVISEE